VRCVFDAGENMLSLVAAHDETPATTRLEQYDPATNQGILGLLRLIDGTIAVEPIAFFDSRGIQNLTLEAKSAKKPTPLNTPQAVHSADITETEDFEDDTESIPASESSSRVIGLLRLVQAELELLAESGLGVSRTTDSLATYAQQLNTIGLTVCATPLERFLEERRRSRQSLDSQATHQAAATLLEAYYISELAAKLSHNAEIC